MSRISVLLADDNRVIRDMLASSLAEHFSVFAPVADGQALVEAALRRRPDVIVSDVSMPVLDGIAAMRRRFDSHLGQAEPLPADAQRSEVGARSDK